MLSPKYFSQLIQDIKNAHNPNPPANLDYLIAREEDNVEDDYMFLNGEEKSLTEIDELEDDIKEQEYIECIEEVEAYLYFSEREQELFGLSIGIDKNMFPAAEMFAEDQLEEVVLEFTSMVRSHRILPVIPPRLSKAKKYALLISMLEETIFTSIHGITSWDWCASHPSSCPYDKYCECLEYEREMKNENSDSKKALRVLQEELKGKLYKGMYFKYEIDESLIGVDDNMSMFISHGIPDISPNVVFFKNRWKDTIILLKEYLKDYTEISAIFNENDPSGYQNLEAFLSLCTKSAERSYFKIEPFYVQFGRIFKGKPKHRDFLEDEEESRDYDPLSDDELPF